MISLIHPSRGRPKMAYQAYLKWQSDKAEHILSLDNDDPCIEEYMDLFRGTKIIVGDSDFVVAATNRGAKEASGTMFIYLSDDFDCPVDWDDMLLDRVRGKDIYALEVNDGFQTNRNLLTLPIISKSLYDVTGYFFHPYFKSMFCDNYMYFEAKLKYKCLVDCYDLLFQHNHFINGRNKMDETYARSNAQYENGRFMFNYLSRLNGWGIQY